MKTKNVIFSIDKEIIKQLNDYNKETMIPMSRLVSKLLEDFFLKQKEKNK